MSAVPLENSGHWDTSALSYYRARYYDPQSGRFASEDPVGFNAGIHFYKYVKNQPLDYLDPLGLKCKQVSPWQEIPQMRGGPLRPYLTVQDGLAWQFNGWDFQVALKGLLSVVFATGLPIIRE